MVVACLLNTFENSLTISNLNLKREKINNFYALARYLI